MRITSKYLPTRRSIKRPLLIGLLLILIYLMDMTPIRTYMTSLRYTYILKPLLWVGLIILIWNMPRIRYESKLKHKRLIYLWAFNFSLIYIVLNIIAGAIYGFGNSPYDHSLRGIIINIVFVGSALVGQEFIRNYLVHNLAKRDNYLLLIGIALFLTLAKYPISKYMALVDIKLLVKFLAEHFLPQVCHGIFASYLVFIGGPIPSIIYLGLQETFIWLSPILPDLKWIVTGLIGVLCPIFFLTSFQSIYLTTARLIKRRHEDNKGFFSWVVTNILSIMLIWFVVGVFPVYPSVIATGSMEPLIYPGDIILVSKMKRVEEIEGLNIGDIIQYRMDSVLISHRIVDIMEDDEYGLLFATKGDNNSAVDGEYVKPQDIRGRVERVVPKLGWPTLIIKSNRDILLK